jgi:uncharacterized caspase-like protein
MAGGMGSRNLARVAAIALAVGSAVFVSAGFRAVRQPAPATRTLHILAVGISSYPNLKDPKPFLTYARPSARSFATRLAAAAEGAFNRIEPTILVDQEASRAGILGAFRKIAAAAKVSDTFVFYYAGDMFKPRSFGRDQDDPAPNLYFVPSDVETTVGDEERIETSKLYELAMAIQARNQFLVLDAESYDFVTALATRIASDEKLLGEARRNVAVLTSKQLDQFGQLTGLLLRGIGGNADSAKSRDGVITVDELRTFVEAQVRERKVDWYLDGSDFPLAGTTAPAAARDVPPPPPPTDRGVGVTPTGRGRSSVRKGRDYALLIATNQYDEWNQLVNPIPDAVAIGDELRQTFGFEVDLKRNPTQRDIYSTLSAYASRTYADDDQLFIFIAGHGTQDRALGEGFLVARDSKRGDREHLSYVDYSRLRDSVNRIPARHILLMLDACFGGSFVGRRPAASRGDADYGSASRDELIHRRMQYLTRLYITSGGEVYVSDGDPGKHSPFAFRLLEALRSANAKNGVVTYAHLMSYLERARMEPRTGDFGDHEPGGDFLFITRQK